MSSNEEKYLTLSDGRTLAYAHNGNPSSSILVIFLHGTFGVGFVDKLQPTLADKDVHYVAPTLAGWGKSSPRDKKLPYPVALANDISQLIEHLYPDQSDLRIYIAGGSFGTVPAQILFGCPFDVFPLGRHIKGCMLLAPFTPFREHKEYSNCLTTANYIVMGAPSQIVPFQLLSRLSKFVISRRLHSPEQAEGFVRQHLFDKMDASERATFSKWWAEKGKEEGQVEREFGANMYKSVQETWDGFMEMADVVNSDWGFKVSTLDEEHCSEKRPVFIVSAKGDTMTQEGMALWLAANYRKAQHRSISGGHLAGLYHLNELWKEFFDLCSE